MLPLKSLKSLKSWSQFFLVADPLGSTQDFKLLWTREYHTKLYRLHHSHELNMYIKTVISLLHEGWKKHNDRLTHTQTVKAYSKAYYIYSDHLLHIQFEYSSMASGTQFVPVL